jgi:hypothetical protein
MLIAALCCLMLYLFELMANASPLAPPIKEPNVPSATVSETATVLLRFVSNKAAFHLEQKWGPPKWTDVIRNS